MSSPFPGDSCGHRRSLKRLSESDHFTNTESPSSMRKIDIDFSPPKKVRFSDHFQYLNERSDPLTEGNLKKHTKRIAFADDDRLSNEQVRTVSQSQINSSNCVMRAWLTDRYDFEWIWASKGGSGSTEDFCYDIQELAATDQLESYR